MKFYIDCVLFGKKLRRKADNSGLEIFVFIKGKG